LAALIAASVRSRPTPKPRWLGSTYSRFISHSPGGERPDADAASRLAVTFGVEQATGGSGIGARQRSHFLLETLERQIDAQPGGVVAEELANVFDGGGVVGGEVTQRWWSWSSRTLARGKIGWKWCCAGARGALALPAAGVTRCVCASKRVGE
jgi:hypothetical protein